MSRPMKIAFLASRNGSGFRAVVAAIEAGEIPARPCLLVSNSPRALALDFARTHGIADRVIPTQDDPVAADHALAEALSASGADLVVLSGYLRRLGPVTLARFPSRIVNIHPGLLPQFGGEGMYGRRVHEAVIQSGAAESGITIHLVDGDYDHGPVIGLWRVPLTPGETAESLEQKITSLEPARLAETVRQIATGELKLPD